MRILRRLLEGVAGNVTTYAGMGLRGRPSGGVPDCVAGKLAGKVGVDLSGGDEITKNRKSGPVAPSVYAAGTGASCGLVRPLPGEVLAPRAGVAVP